MNIQRDSFAKNSWKNGFFYFLYSVNILFISIFHTYIKSAYLPIAIESFNIF